MTRISIHPDCGHSPKKEFLKNFNIAFATGDADFLINSVSDDIHWIIYGDKEIQGKEAFRNEMNIMKDYTADELQIHHILTHGKEAAISGEMKMGNRTYAFCDLYEFTSAGSQEIRGMKTYIIKTGDL
ncbi:MAG: nuclear transport factor 2 family protein [Ekhidna sp.]|uniref:nuclear transport factor 2 family protein n=1 Tax=Ekhidna sp. TaxID=2608089 RepID=UPI0032EF5B99